MILAELTKRIARLVTDVTDGTATQGTTTTLTDANLTQQNDWWNRGTVWFNTGQDSGYSRAITDFASGVLTFPALSVAPVIYQMDRNQVVGTITGNGNAAVTILASGITNFPKTINVAVTAPDNAATVAGKIRTALGADADVAANYTVSGSTNEVILTRKVAAASITFNLSVDNGTCTGLTPTESANLAQGVGCTYSVARGAYPYEQLIAGITTALSETFVVQEMTVPALQDPLTGDGETLIFTPYENGIVKVLLEDPDDDTHTYLSTHWRETEDYKLEFDEGYAPLDRWIIRPFVKAAHWDVTGLGVSTGVIDNQINPEWVVWKAAEYVLYWGVGQYGQSAEYRIEERLNRVLTKLKGLYARKPVLIVHTAGHGGY